ncbi:hypothetical protein U1Q18_013987 [Sarracenia purpurea var. burkii]
MLTIDFCRNNQSRVSRRLCTPLVARDSQNAVALYRSTRSIVARYAQTPLCDATSPTSHSCGMFSSFPVAACSAPTHQHRPSLTCVVPPTGRVPALCTTAASLSQPSTAAVFSPKHRRLRLLAICHRLPKAADDLCNLLAQGLFNQVHCCCFDL